MRISTFKYFIVDALKSLKRNKTVSIASVLTVAASLFLMGVFLLTILNVRQGIQSVESKLEVKIVLKDNIKLNDKNNIENTLKHIDGVTDIKFESKKDALEKWKDRLGKQNENLAEGMDKQNPLPMSYIVKVSSADKISSVVSKIKKLPGIEEIKDGKKIVNKIISLTNVIKWTGVVLFIICLIVSIFLIANTIKLTVYARRREVNIMKYVGATDWFIRWPFIIEGIIIGIIGALIATIVLFYSYRAIYLKLTSSGLLLMLMKLIEPSYVFDVFTWKFILVGSLIGSIGSIISMRKFLRV